MASREELDDDFSLEVETRFLKDEMAAEVEINRLTRPYLMTYYSDAVKNWKREEGHILEIRGRPFWALT